MHTLNEQLAGYRTFVEGFARRYANPKYGAEVDDLVQEGMISIWQALEAGVNPSAEVMVFAMRNWVRTMRRQMNV